ncbi:hypothetical protein O181_075696 [Austropuccinia psidii MF-1]|uniref:Reverse transcriptase Ty1/copia-type domain-containing protein n=1 Tax=Austropuccinia psidii MF-1 TaxID=1389203 RepID=A0A9Q3F906_9BASI|nr:hypothetical protein [Austropuccinia psidii MF-1]
MLNGSNLPSCYWAEAILTATMLCNLIPTPSRHNLSPYALWKGVPPRIKRLRIFGCRAIISIPRSHRDWKLGPTGSEGILLGYENDNTSYRVLRLSDKKVVISRHVTFDENSFPSLRDAPSEPLTIDWEASRTDSGLVDEAQPEEAAVVDETHSEETAAPSVNNSPVPLAEQPPGPISDQAPRRIRVIGPRHPTIINSEIDSTNILTFPRRPKVYLTTSEDCPRTFNSALNSPLKDEWSIAVNKEFASMNRLQVWDIVELKSDYRLVGTTWVFKTKRDPQGNVLERKARLCAQGFSQTSGIDYHKTYSPTGRLNSLRSLIAMAATRNLQFHQIDVKSAFLNAPLSEIVYLSIPQGMTTDRRKFCLKLRKAIYGLKQAPLAWYERLKSWLLGTGFRACLMDPCVFFRQKPSDLWLYIHVDDIAIFGSDIEPFKKEISSEFDIKDIGTADLLLGVKVGHSSHHVSLDQQHFTESLRELYGMSECRPVATPLIPNEHLSPATDDEVSAFNSLGVSYRSAIGSINYLSTATRPDLSFAVSSLSQFLERPGLRHWRAFLHVLRYLRGTPNVGLVYSRHGAGGLIAYSDADWGNCQTTRRSTTGYLVIFNGCVTTWKTRKQPSVSLSTAEAEYKSLCDLASELLWLRQWCTECHILDTTPPIPVHEDNQSCINAANGNVNLNNKRMKHVNIQLHFIKEAVQSSQIRLVYTPTTDMLADFLTKSVCRPTLSRSLSLLGILRLEVRGDEEN